MNPGEFRRESEFRWIIDAEGPMRVPAVLYADEPLLRDMDDKVRQQICNVATLPGIVGAACAMPDAHWGYGFPIGGVAAFALDEEVQRDLVAAQRVVAARLDRRGRLELTTIPRRAVVVENDLAVEVFEAGHQNPKISVALSSASARASTSSVPLYR